jgi:hypothetical protein
MLTNGGSVSILSRHALQAAEKVITTASCGRGSQSALQGAVVHGAFFRSLVSMRTDEKWSLAKSLEQPLLAGWPFAAKLPG